MWKNIEGNCENVEIRNWRISVSGCVAAFLLSLPKPALFLGHTWNLLDGYWFAGVALIWSCKISWLVESLMNASEILLYLQHQNINSYFLLSIVTLICFICLI